MNRRLETTDFSTFLTRFIFFMSLIMFVIFEFTPKDVAFNDFIKSRGSVVMVSVGQKVTKLDNGKTEIEGWFDRDINLDTLSVDGRVANYTIEDDFKGDNFRYLKLIVDGHENIRIDYKDINEYNLSYETMSSLRGKHIAKIIIETVTLSGYHHQ